MSSSHSHRHNSKIFFIIFSPFLSIGVHYIGFRSETEGVMKFQIRKDERIISTNMATFTRGKSE